jgi:flagellar basal-body rod modification protein FlgD
MEITSTTTPTAAANRAAAEADAVTNVATTDFDTYLTLLTTQLRNQDPLNPTDSTEFVSQLASFSAVEQQINTNDTLEKILAALGGGSSAGLAEWIGREVRAAARARFEGEPVTVETTPNPEADAAVLEIRNDFDQVVARRAIDPKASQVVWDGRDELGVALPYGQYAFSVLNSKGGAALDAAPGQVYGKVSEVRIEDGAPTLVLEGGERVALDAVTAIR